MNPKPLIVTAPHGEDKVLLHACCAPCSGAIIECLLRSGIRPTVFFSNANIFPQEEYMHRKDECVRYSLSLGLDIVDDDWSHEDWLEAVKGLEAAPERGPRCLRCFSYRLERAARYAADNGFKLLTTTLASSRWKSLDQVNSAGQRACSHVEGVEWWDMNWRKGGLQERRGEIIREMNFYNQLYCGCEFSLQKID